MTFVGDHSLTHHRLRIGTKFFNKLELLAAECIIPITHATMFFYELHIEKQ